MKEAKEFLEEFFQQRQDLRRQMANPQLDIFQLWPQVLLSLDLATLAQNSQVQDFEHQHLRLTVRHSVFLQELKLREGLWRPALEEACRQRQFTNYRIQKVSYRVQNSARTRSASLK